MRATVSAAAGALSGGGPAQVTSRASAPVDRSVTSVGSAFHTLRAAPAATASSVRPAGPPATQTMIPSLISSRASATTSARRTAAGAKGMP